MVLDKKFQLTQPKRGEKMKKVAAFFALALLCVLSSYAQDKAPLRLVQTIPVPGVQRKWDHFAVDVKNNRLFVTSEEEPAVEVFDLKSNKHLNALTEFKEPHNAVPFPGKKEIYVVDGGASEIKILDFDTLKLKGHIALSIDADPIAYDAAAKYLYVVNGGRAAKTPYCLISVVDTTKNTKLADMKLDSPRLESMALENSSKRLFVNMTSINKIGVVDREKREVIDTWPLTAAKENVSMQYDESNHRLFVTTRKPSKLIVVNTDTGKEVTSLDLADYVDDLAWDAKNHRLYATGGGGQGAISVVQQSDADTYKIVATIPTKPGAKTGKLSPELNKFYVGVPTREKEKQEAQILIYEVLP
jgi:DNA-binding beta-propeller fold protein YncE